MANAARLTKAGAILLAKAIAGNQLTFTRGAFGDAAGHDAPTERQIDALTALLNERMSLPITDFRIENEQAIVTVLVENEEVAQAFHVAEGGVFAKDPETDEELLYSYFYDGPDGYYMPAGNEDFQLEFEYEFITAVSNAQNVTAIIDKSKRFVTYAEFETHINSYEPHPNLDHVTHPEFNAHIYSATPHPNLDHVTHPEFNAHVNSAEPHPNLDHVTHSELTSHIDSTNPHPNWDVVKDISPYDRRLKQIEINLANAYILLEKVYGLGDQSNLQLVEDYSPLNSTATYSAQVYSTASKKYLRVFDPGKLRMGGDFTITDGYIYQEQTHIDYLSKWGDYDTPYIAGLSSALSRDYKGANYIYRTTATVKDNKAYGAGELRNNPVNSSVTWKGKEQIPAVTLPVDFYESLASSYELDGDWGFTNDGFFTLE